ncbi:MAG: hypothetical protein LBS68_01520 [Puniceicoccales bacterium]|jgi:hypothetical protein|nr:hypothetical protein [Puniceicoccales bacterium]
MDFGETTGRMDLQSAIQSLQQRMGVGADGDAPAAEGEVNDRSAFVPNAASLVKAAQAKATQGSDGPMSVRGGGSGGSGGLPVRSEDMAKEAKATRAARTYAQRLDPNADGTSYVNFKRQLWDDALRRPEADQETTGEEERAGERQEGKGSGDSFEADGEAQPPVEEREARPLAGQDTDLSAYPQPMQRLLRLAMDNSKSVTEQYNLLSYAQAQMGEDINTYLAQEAVLNQQIEKLSHEKDAKSQKKLERTGKHLEAIRMEMKVAKSLKGQLDAILGAMKEKDGPRIDDGYNLIPKANFVVANMPIGEGGVTGTDLASNYRDEVLNTKNPSQFFDNYMLKHHAMPFNDYIVLILKLLGDDIQSVNPSRAKNQLQAIRDGLFCAEMSGQIFDNVVVMDQKLDHLLILRQKETGIYEERFLFIDYAPDKIRISIAYGQQSPTFLKEVPLSPTSDHFAEITKVTNSEHVDGFAIPNAKDGEARSFRFAVQRRYGLPVLRDLPDGWKNASSPEGKTANDAIPSVAAVAKGM